MRRNRRVTAELGYDVASLYPIRLVIYKYYENGVMRYTWYSEDGFVHHRGD